MFRKNISLLIIPFTALVSLQANDPFGDDIFKEMQEMRKEIDKIFERMDQRTNLWNYPSRRSFIPANRTTDTLFKDLGSYYEYNTQIPESPDNQIDISITNGVLHFKATVDTVKKRNDPNIQMKQRYVSMIQRSETLPKDADPRSLKSVYKEGRLVLILEKKKIITQPKVNKQTDQIPVQEVKKQDEAIETEAVKPEKEEKSLEDNATKIKVPHTSSHV